MLRRGVSASLVRARGGVYREPGGSGKAFQRKETKRAADEEMWGTARKQHEAWQEAPLSSVRPGNHVWDLAVEAVGVLCESSSVM